MILSLQELLALKQEIDDTAIHFLKDGFVVASIFRNVEKLIVKAQLGDDQNVTNFSFEYSGPIAVVYCNQITLQQLEDRKTHLGVMAIMSAVTYADVCNRIGNNNVFITPTTVMQFDAGDPERYELARQLICHHTNAEWDDGYLEKMYREQVKTFLKSVLV